MDYTENDFAQLFWLTIRLVEDYIERKEVKTEYDLNVLYEVKLTKDLLIKRHPRLADVNDPNDIGSLIQLNKNDKTK